MAPLFHTKKKVGIKEKYFVFSFSFSGYLILFPCNIHKLIEVFCTALTNPHPELKQTFFLKIEKNSNWSITWLSTYSTGFMTLKYEQTLRNNSTILSHWAPFIFLIHDDKIQRFSVFFFMNKPSAAKYIIRILFLWASKWAKSTLYILSVLRKCQQHRHTHNAHNAEMFFLSTSTRSAIFFSTKAHVNSMDTRTTHFFI